MPDDHVQLLRASGLLNVPEFPKTKTPPADLCKIHAMAWCKWWDYSTSYDPRHPHDFGSVGPIADARTSHTERRTDWLRRGAKQLDLVAQICRRANSPECVR